MIINLQSFAARLCAVSLALGVMMHALHAKPAEAEGKQASAPARESVPSRIMVFGWGPPLGVLSVRPAGAGSQEPWQKLQEGRASGKVRVPTNYDVRLDLDPKSRGDLSMLDSLGPGDLQMVNMADCKVNDAGLAHLAKQNSIRILNLRKNPITDKGMAHLAGMTAMETLYLEDTQITDTGLENLKGMKTLYHLKLGESGKLPAERLRRITDAGVAKLSGLNSVIFLDLSGSGVTDAGLNHLAAMSGLYHLNLARTMVTEGGLATVARLTGLSELDISGTGAITKSGAATLESMVGLQSLTIHKGQIPADVLDGLKSKLRNIKINEIAP